MMILDGKHIKNIILDGKHIKNIILDEVKEEVKKLSVKPKLVVIQVGNNEASNIYIKQKKNMCMYVGYEYEHIKLDDVSTDDLVDLINTLNNDNSVTGILVQLPLPNVIDTDRVINTISPCKDVDGLTDINNGMLFHGKDALYSCTPYGVMELLDRYDISVSGKCVVIVGRSDLVGKPMSMMMLNANATVMMCHSKTKNLDDYTKMADILVVAVGKPNFITSDMIRKDAVVIDIGINRTKDGLCGDVDFESIKDKCCYITPVPGGVGQMTVAMLAKNVLKSYKKQRS